MSSKLRIVLGYSYFRSANDVRVRVEKWLSRLRSFGFTITPFVLTLNPPNDRLSWRELDRRWRERDGELLRLYERLAETLSDNDVFINWNGINVHPEALQSFPTFNVFACFDDPESTEDLSRPVATQYDCCLVGNIACLDMYRDWGCKNVGWWPLGFHSHDFDHTLTTQDILEGTREHDITLLCERVSQWRDARLNEFVRVFPNGKYFGRGWPLGFLDESKRVPLLQTTRIGLNIHNSLGPVNYRTFYLPANGIMQICDNPKHLSHIFKLQEEVVAYETINEAIDKCRYYLEHERERREIAARGFERATREYNEESVFSKVVGHIESCLNDRTDRVVIQLPRPASTLNAIRNSLSRTSQRLIDASCRSIGLSTSQKPDL